MREFALNEFWHTFVDDRPFLGEARITERNAQSKFAASMWTYTKAVLCDGQASTQDYLRRWLLSITECVIWVCEEVFGEHEWVSELTISMQEEEVLVVLDHRLDVPCVVQWFSAPSRPSQRFEGNGTKCAQYHEVTNLAIKATFNAPCGGFNTPRACMLRPVAARLDRAPDNDWSVGRDMMG